MASAALPRFLLNIFFLEHLEMFAGFVNFLGGMQTEKTFSQILRKTFSKILRKTFSQILRKTFSKIPRMQNSLPLPLKVTARDFPEKFQTAALCCKYCSTPLLPFWGGYSTVIFIICVRLRKVLRLTSKSGMGTLTT